MVGEPETLLVDSTLLSVLHPRQVSQSPGCLCGAAWVRWGSFSVYGVKLHLISATNGVPLSYELTPANIADVCLAEELLAKAALGERVARKLLGDLAYRSKELREALAEVGILLNTEPSERRRGLRQRIEIAISSLKRVFGLGQTLATTLVGLATRIAAKICAYTYALMVNRMLARPQDHLTGSLERYGDAEDGQPVGVVSGAVQGVYDPTGVLLSYERSSLLGQHSVSGESSEKDLPDDLLCLLVHIRDKVNFTLVPDGVLPAEAFAQHLARFLRR